MNRPISPSPAPTRGNRRSPHFARAVTLTSFSTFVAMLGYTGPLGNAATLATALHTSTTGVTWILSSMSVGLAVSLLLAGALADGHGRRRVFAAGAWLFAAGSIVCALAPGAGVFVAGRVLEGLGAAGIVATGLGLVAVASSHPAHRAVAASWWAASMGAGIALGPVLTGLFDLVDRWRAFYLLLVCLGLVTALAAGRLFTETTIRSGRRIDVVGSALLTGGLGLLLVALVEARQGAAGLATGCGVLAAGCLVAFVVSQIRGRHPMLPRALFGRSDFLAATTAALATGAGVIALMSFASTFFVTGLGMTTFGAGALLALWSGTSAVSGVLVRRLPARYVGAPQMMLGLVGVGVGLLLLTAIGPGTSVWRLVPGLLVAGVASGLLNAGLARQSVASVPETRAAVGIGTNNTARYVASSVGVTLVSIIATGRGAGAAGLFAGWNEVAVLTAAVTLLGAVLVGVLSRQRATG